MIGKLDKILQTRKLHKKILPSLFDQQSRQNHNKPISIRRHHHGSQVQVNWSTLQVGGKLVVQTPLVLVNMGHKHTATNHPVWVVWFSLVLADCLWFFGKLLWANICKKNHDLFCLTPTVQSWSGLIVQTVESSMRYHRIHFSILQTLQCTLRNIVR